MYRDLSLWLTGVFAFIAFFINVMCNYSVIKLARSDARIVVKDSVEHAVLEVVHPIPSDLDVIDCAKYFTEFSKEFVSMSGNTYAPSLLTHGIDENLSLAKVINSCKKKDVAIHLVKNISP